MRKRWKIEGRKGWRQAMARGWDATPSLGANATVSEPMIESNDALRQQPHTSWHDSRGGRLLPMTCARVG